MIPGTVISSITGIFQIARSEDIALDVRKGTFELGEFGEGEGSHPPSAPRNTRHDDVGWCHFPWMTFRGM